MSITLPEPVTTPANEPRLPPGWELVQVKDVGDVQLGRRRAPQHHTGPHMRPYLRVANVFEDRIDTSDVLEMNFSPQEYETYKLQYGDILRARGRDPAKARYEEPAAPDVEGLPGLPEGWGWTTIDQAAECLDSKRVPVNKEEREIR